MSLVLWSTTALVIWVVLWALGVKSFDAALLAVTIILVGATIESLKKYLPGRNA
jgi:hypothetical protein